METNFFNHFLQSLLKSRSTLLLIFFCISWFHGICEQIANDPLNNFSQLYSYSENLKIDSNNPLNFNGDSARVVRTNLETGLLIYQTDSITDFSIEFWGVDENSGNVLVWQSENGTEYNTVETETEKQSFGYRFLQIYTAKNALSINTKFLKIEITGGNGAWKGQIGSVSFLKKQSMRLVRETFYIDAETGNNNKNGTSPTSAFQSLSKINEMGIIAGDSVLLKSGQTFYGTIEVLQSGTREAPIFIGKYHGDEKPVINSAGYLAGVSLSNAGYVIVSELEITSNGQTAIESQAQTNRYGVLVTAAKSGVFENIRLQKLNIHHIFATQNVDGDGQNPTSNMGMGINVAMNSNDAIIKNITIEDCRISMVGHTGIKIFGNGNGGETTYLDSVFVFNNYLEHIGGPGMVPGRCSNVIVRGNIVNFSGSNADPRMHNRGSGIWPWTSKNVLIEKNRFMHAWGKYDSCGAHIDFNCSNVIIQHNFSFDNAGGFVEILGNDQNCVYRYNVSVNDGYRKNGVNGALSDGHIFWVSGYVGSGKDPIGASDCRIYNNTIYTAPHIKTGIRLQSGTKNNRFENNIIYMEGELSYENLGENNTFDNNLYFGNFPKMPFGTSDIFADPGLLNPGDSVPESYKLLNSSVAINTGKIIGNEVTSDFWGEPLFSGSAPDRGAHETPFISEKIYTILAKTKNEGGAIFPSGEISFDANATIPFTIFPNPGYEIADVWIDGISVGNDSVYVFQNLNDNHNIQVKFIAPPGSVTDPLNNFNLVAYHSENMKIQTENPESMENDFGRAARNNTENGFLVYNFKGISNFEIVFWGINGDNGKLNVYASSDGLNFERLVLKVKSFYDLGYRNKTVYVPENALPENTNFLKLELLNSDAWWKPQIGSVYLEWEGDITQTTVFEKEKIELILFPNPTNNKIHISGMMDNKEYQIFNSTGENVLNGRYVSEIDVSSLKNGIYILKNSEGKTAKFVVKE